MGRKETIETARLILARPRTADVDEIFARYAGDPEVTRHLIWPTHRSRADTESFLAFSDIQWIDAAAGPYLIRTREDGCLIGSTGLDLESEDVAMTGYLLTREARGKGYATEALRAMVALATQIRVRLLYAICHVDNAASARVLERCGFERDHEWVHQQEFPNLAPGVPQPVLCYSMLLR